MLLLVMLLAAAGAAVAAAAGGRGSPTARGGGSSGSPPPDPGIPPAEWVAIQTALSQETDPEMLMAFAQVLDNQGFHNAATMLRHRAIALGG